MSKTASQTSQIGTVLITVATEQYGLSSLKNDYHKTPEGQLIKEDRSLSHSSVSQFFRSVFLPQGYPESVSDDYAEYQMWDTIQAFASSISNSLATHSLLQGMGVGDEAATVLAATFTWLLKNGTGMTGSIIFAWMKGNQLDCDAKRWRLFADFLNDFSISLEIMAPLAGTYFRWVVCFAGVCKSLVGVAGGATRAALTQHQARRNNMADVSAKDGSQETLVNLGALICSLGLLPLVSGQLVLTGLLFIMMTTLHLFANYRAVKAVRMESLNLARFHLIMNNYFSSGRVPPVDTVNAAEPVFWTLKPHWTIDVGMSFNSIETRFDNLREVYGGISSKYLLDFNRQTQKVTVVLSPEATMTDQLQACVQAELIIFILSHSGHAVSSDLSEWISRQWLSDNHTSMLLQSFDQTKGFFPTFLNKMEQQGWRTDSCLLGTDEWRTTWDFSDLANASNRKNV